MADDDDADLAQAIANSLRDARPQQQAGNASIHSSEVRDVSQEDLELSRLVEESYRHAKRHRQEHDDAELASDLAAIDSMAQSESHERERIVAQDAQLASDITSIDRLSEAEMNECQRLALQELSDSFSARRGLERKQGSWDCPQCTFHNRPYGAKCGACCQAAPNSVLVFSDLPPRLRYGVELELIIPSGKKDGLTCPWIAKQLSALGISTTYAGYTHETTEGWKIVTDASLQASSDDLCFELVSPVLVGEGGLESLRTMLESVRRIGININSSCGFHVHVDATAGALSSLAGLKRLAHCFVSLESAFDCLVARDASRQARSRRANRHRYCRSNALAFGLLSNKQRWNRINNAQSVSDLVLMVNPGNDRYRKLNLTNLTKPNRPSTCEFRQHGGVSELLVGEAWIRLVLRFCDLTTRDSTLSNACLLRQNAPLKEELETLLRVVNCPGLEYFYLLERNLFPLMKKSAHGDRRKEWKCRCGRRFKDCRALAQHSSATGHQTM